MLKSNLCDKSDAYIILKGTVTIPGQAADAPAHEADRAKKQIIFKHCAPFTDCMSEINNTHLDNAKYLDVVIPMYKLFEYSKNYSRASGSVWQDSRDGPTAARADSESFKFNVKITGRTKAASTVEVEIVVALKYLSNFWRTLELPLIHREISLMLNWSQNCLISNRSINIFHNRHKALYSCRYIIFK